VSPPLFLPRLSTCLILSRDGASWESFPELQAARAGHQMALVRDEVFAMGGWGDRGMPLCSVEKYSEAEKRWKFVASMKRGRSGFGCAVIDGKIYVAGGDRTHTAEVYDPIRNEWWVSTYIRLIVFHAG